MKTKAMTFLFFLSAMCSVGFAQSVDDFGPYPGTIGAIPADISPTVANFFSFDGGPTGTDADTGIWLNMSALINPGAPLIVSGKMDVPTGAFPSPLFNAQPFSQQLLLFEEFGLSALGPSSSVVGGTPFPYPQDAQSSPNSASLDDFITQYTSNGVSLPYPYPSRSSNVTDLNPWKSRVEEFLGRQINAPPSEGRPEGEDWAHQRWYEFFPTEYFVTVQAQARPNTGLRDPFQRHHYLLGEFGPGGLYHNTAGTLGFNGTTANIPVRFHPNFPIQNRNSLWTFDGTFPPKLLQARYGQPLLFRHYNALPIDPSANMGFGLHTISTHEHNGHNPAESDGFTQAFFFPGQFYDYHWPMILAGNDSINTDASDPRAGFPDGNGGINRIRGDWRETMSTHWFHDHMLDYTAQNVYKGNAAMMNYYSAIDRGNEAIDDGVNLRFPSGTALDWGNRDYDVNLMIADKAWDANGQLFFNIFNKDGYVGDRLLVNWTWSPYLDVRARRYRFRIVNGSVSRVMKLALVEKHIGSQGEFPGPVGSGISYDTVPFYMVANDGNIMEHAVYFDGNKTVNGYTNTKGILPSQGIAERYDIIVDFSQFQPGSTLYLVNLLEHKNGKSSSAEIPLASVLNGSYAVGFKDGRYLYDQCVTPFLEFRVQPYNGTDLSMNPAEYVEGQKTMVPLVKFSQAELDGAIKREFVFGTSDGTDKKPWTVKVDGSAGFAMDPRRLSVSNAQGALQVWHLKNSSGGSHPIHIHFEEGQILQRGGLPPPEWEKWSRKDLYRIGPEADSLDSVDVVVRFREFLGTFMEHCHNTQHEDNSMLLRWDLEAPGQIRIMPTPMPSWDGCGYVPSFALPTFRKENPPPPPAPAVTLDAVSASPAGLVFGLVSVGTTSAVQTIFVTNSGNANLAVASVVSNSADFAIVRDSCSGVLTAPLATCSVDVVFRPIAAVPSNAAISIVHNALSSPTVVQASGTGSAPVFAISSIFLSFPSTNLGSQSAPQSLRVTNNGNADLQINSLTISGPAASDFIVLNPCTTISAGTHCDIGVAFNPTVTGSRSATLSIQHNAVGSPYPVSLSGVGVLLPTATIASPTSFEVRQAGMVSTKNVKVTNNGPGQLIISGVSTSGSSSFSATFGTCKKALAPSAFCNLSVSYKPATSGTHTGTVTIRSNAANDPTSGALIGSTRR